MIKQPAIAHLTAATSTAHPMGAWTMASILCLCFLGILAGAVFVTVMLDRQRQADLERIRRINSVRLELELTTASANRREPRRTGAGT